MVPTQIFRQEGLARICWSVQIFTFLISHFPLVLSIQSPLCFIRWKVKYFRNLASKGSSMNPTEILTLTQNKISFSFSKLILARNKIPFILYFLFNDQKLFLSIQNDKFRNRKKIFHRDSSRHSIQIFPLFLSYFQKFSMIKTFLSPQVLKSCLI